MAAGEQAGALETLLDRVAIHREKSEQLNGRIKKAMTYPVAVLVVASLVTGILLVHVVPQFQTLFAGVDGKLPTLTLQVIALSAFVQQAWWMLVLGIAAGIMGLRKAYRSSPRFRYWLDAGLLNAPLAGKLLTKSAVARYARTLSTTLQPVFHWYRLWTQSPAPWAMLRSNRQSNICVTMYPLACS